MGLHAHGHVDLKNDHDQHETTIATSQQHDHAFEKVHLANHLNDSHDLVNDHNGHGEKMFEIENTAIVKKLNNNFDLTLLLFITVLTIAWISLHLLQIVRPFRNIFIPFSTKLYLKNQPLRAPPFFA